MCSQNVTAVMQSDIIDRPIKHMFSELLNKNKIIFSKLSDLVTE
jgi:hypothetical protein